MGIYINGMEMPKEGSWTTVRIYPDGTCAVPNWQGDCTLIKGAKAVRVPPHGDLIERDALRASIRESIEECRKWANEVDKDTMMYARISQSVGTFVECSLRAKAAPTIIPADVPDNNVGNIPAEEGET